MTEDERFREDLAAYMRAHPYGVTLFTWPIEYKRLERPGEWRLSFRVEPRLAFCWRVFRYVEGRRYAIRFAWFQVNLMVKA